MIKRKESDPFLASTRSLYEAMFRFDNSIARVLKMHVTDLRCANALETGPLSPGQIGDRLALTSGSVTSMLDRMEALGYITRAKDPNDSRRSHVELTTQFYQEAEKAYGLLGESIRTAFEDYSPRRLARITKEIDLLASSFDDARKMF